MAEPISMQQATHSLVVRPGRFAFGEATPAHWIADKPELSQMINGASLVMPFLEPFLIASIQAARGQIADPALDADAAARPSCLRPGSPPFVDFRAGQKLRL